MERSRTSSVSREMAMCYIITSIIRTLLHTVTQILEACIPTITACGRIKYAMNRFHFNFQHHISKR
uniref:Uncharacterized protein n=1 Tax=Arundo donax TaxID=35708 RepID=A0A0A9H116_ARUDO